MSLFYNSQNNPYKFHPYIASSYTDVHGWLGSKINPKSYRKWVNYSELDQKLSLESAATQYYIYFPAHYFKVKYILDKVITYERISDWLNFNSHICILDVGCGAGAASAAFIEALILLKEKKEINNRIDVLCVGIDINHESLAIYKQLITSLQQKVDSLGIKVNCLIQPKGIQEAIVPIYSQLKKQREQWNKPCLSHTLIMQSNVVSPLSDLHGEQQNDYQKLIDLGISTNEIVDNYSNFGEAEALAYKLMMEETPIDYLHLITIDTGKYLPSIQQLEASVNQVFRRSKHDLCKIGDGTHYIYYENPQGSYYRDEKKNKVYSTPEDRGFHINVTTITNTYLRNDFDWQSVLSLDNLELAWVRARKNLLQESLADEMELLLFEVELKNNLKRLSQQLNFYIGEAARVEDRIPYGYPKNPSSFRPKELSRLEEEILSVAIIQKLGNKFNNSFLSSCAYRLDNSDNVTEYLYQNWYDTYYEDFIGKARSQAKQYKNATILRVDIKSFYTKILQDKLLALSEKELRTNSSRINWLLKLLLTENLNRNIHEINQGIVQGNLGSGFYANIYLSDLDAKFQNLKEKNISFFRYVDDMIFVIPNPEDEESLYQDLEQELKLLGLSLAPNKTQKYTANEFLDSTESDKDLNKLNKDFNQLLYPLWSMNSSYRKRFRSCDESDDWWKLIQSYRTCLSQLSIYITETDLSRRIWRHLFKDGVEHNQQLKLKLPWRELINKPMLWQSTFRPLNHRWIKRKEEISKEIIDLFLSSFKILNNSAVNDQDKKVAERRLRSSVKKMSFLGFAEVHKELFDILYETPWLLKNQLPSILESLAIQGYHQEMMNLLEYYEQKSSPDE